MPGFNLFRSDRKSRIGGGVCIYVHSKYQDCNIIHSTPLVSNLEILWLQCTIQGILYYIACCYHPPKLRYPSSQYCDQLSADVQILIASVRVQDLQCGTYVNFEGLARVAIQGLTWVNFRFLAYPVNSGRPAWSMVRTRRKLLMATAQVTRVSAGEL